MTNITRRLFLSTTAIFVALFGTSIESALASARATQFAAVYSTRSKLLRRLIVPDHDWELDDPLHVGQGESMMRFRLDTVPYRDSPSIQRLIAEHHGLAPCDVPSGRCVLVDQAGDVVHAIMADPEIDDVEGHRLIASDTAQVGWKYDGERFLARFVEAGRDGIVMRVFWHDPDEPLPEMIATQHPDACHGDLVAWLKRHDAPSSGTRRL